MKSYARIDDGKVAEVFQTDANIADLFAPGLVWVEIPSGSSATVGWIYSDGAFSSPPPPSLADVKAAQIAILTEAYNTSIQQPVNFTTSGGITKQFQSDMESQDKLLKATTGYNISGSTPSGFYWVSLDNARVPFTISDLKGLYAAMLAQGLECFQNLQDRKDSVNSANTISAAQSVIW